MLNLTKKSGTNRSQAARVSSKRKRTSQDEVWITIYRAMLRQRMIDDKMMTLQRQGRIGFYGPIRGQEAATVASAAALDDKDWVIPALREAGAALYRGLPLEQYVAQLFGNSADWIQGKQMPCHPTHKEKNYVSMSSCIATQLPHAVGIAMAAKYRNDPIVVMAYMGDGATSEGDFHAAMNFAGVFKAPVVFFCQNNHWAISVPSSEQTASKTFAEKAHAYGFEGIVVDGNDATAVFDVTKKAVESARKGGGPVLIEAETYRVLGHTTSDDPSRYRDAKEVAKWEKRDPILLMKNKLEGEGLWTKELEDAAQSEITSEITAAIKAVENAPAPSLDSLFDHVFETRTPALERQRAQAIERNL